MAANAPQTNSGRISSGGTVEQEVRFNLAAKEQATLSLRESSMDNAVAIQNRLNDYFNARVAVANDSRSISLKRPPEMSMVEFLSVVGNLNVSHARTNKITIDEKSGTIVAGKDIRVLPVVVTHGAFTLSVDESLEQNGQPLTISSVAAVLQQMGAGANEVIAILQALKRSGALEAELEVVN